MRTETLERVTGQEGGGRDGRWSAQPPSGRVSMEELVCAARDRGRSPEFAHLDDKALERHVMHGASAIAAATCRWLEAVAELVARDIWAYHGFPTPGSWLAWAVSMSGSTAREHVRVALSLHAWPQLHERFREGRISYSKVRAITRHATPELEDLLLRFAEHADGAQLERILTAFGRTEDPEDPTPSAWETRGLDVDIQPGGAARMTVTGPVELVMRVQHVLDRLGERMRAEDLAAARTAAAEDDTDPVRLEGVGAYRFDALVETLEAASDELPADSSGAQRHTLVLHLTRDHLSVTDAAPPGVEPPVLVEAETPRGRRPLAMSPRVIDRLACQAGLIAALHDPDGRVEAMTGSTDRTPPRLRRALVARDRRCRYPGCGRTRNLHAHHIHYASQGGPTRLDNLLLLCSRHHHEVHDRGVTIRHDGQGHARFVHASGRVLEPSPALPGVDPDRDPLDERTCGYRASGEALRPTEYEPRIDLRACVDAIVQEIELQRSPDRAIAA